MIMTKIMLTLLIFMLILDICFSHFVFFIHDNCGMFSKLEIKEKTFCRCGFYLNKNHFFFFSLSWPSMRTVNNFHYFCQIEIMIQNFYAITIPIYTSTCTTSLLYCHHQSEIGNKRKGK